MALSKQEFTNYISQFQFREMFNYMGWDNDTTNTTVVVDDISFPLKAVAIKCGLKILTVDVDVIPPSETRKKIDRKVSRLFYHYILIFNDRKNRQVWMVPVTKNQKRELVFIDFLFSQDFEFIFQKVKQLTFALEEEEKLTIVDVSKRVNGVFAINSEKITSDFYKDFSNHHQSFLKFLKDFGDKVTQEWYASLMLNRLMFCYFIQKKGFLNDDVNYLRSKLNEIKEKKGKDKFFDFYYDFLKTLFHKGLGSPEHPSELQKLIGNIPYLNGGLFDEHEIEIQNPKAKIPDQAFENIFNFFDEYQWHLDTSITSNGKDINPDVIGYIFEKYINHRAQMGAYYTKEDITDYISKNCILPFLFDETKRNYSKAFSPDTELWYMVKQSNETYIYDAIKKGVNENLPDEIAAGIKEVNKRSEWNKPAPDGFALPTEIWREVVDRRNRYSEIKNKIEKGEVTGINDFITYNLNIRQFAEDVISNSTDSKFVEHFYKSMAGHTPRENRNEKERKPVSILDPTCGSGAFLFAAMNILEELYAACIRRMKRFVEEEPGKHDYFEWVLKQMKQHPNEEYFIYKNIILKNLYGVDIMKEAVEIAKLRLFLKLVATVQADYRKSNLGLEPLPDIDFNIRSGNTLIGFATEAELDKALSQTLDGQVALPAITEKIEIVAMAYKNFKNDQVTIKDYKTIKADKLSLEKRLKELNHKLNLLLHRQVFDLKYEKWLESYKPFHWFAVFYEIVSVNKGFDVIIGNPPYVNLKKVDYTFNQNSFKCIDCKDLFALTIERSFSIIKANGRNGFIIPLSGLSTETMSSLRNLIFTNTKHSWNSYYSASDQPASLFNGVRHRLLITLNETKKDSTEKQRYSTNFLKWFSSEREDLFLKFIKYADASTDIPSISKISCSLEKSLLKKLGKRKTLNNYIANTGSVVYYHNAPVHWGKIFDFVPYFSIAGKQQQSSHLKELFFNSKEDAAVVICLLNSSLYYWFNWQYSNCRDLSQKDIFRIPISLNKMEATEKKLFISLKNNLMKDLKKNSKLYQRVSQNIRTEFDAFYPLFSKPIIDEIDKALAKHYDFTDEETDFIINYDIKYRMGKELEREE